MRINWKLVLALLLIPSLCFGGMIIRKVSSSTSETLVFHETFETYPGADNTWTTDSGTPNYDYDATSIGMTGSYALELADSGGKEKIDTTISPTSDETWLCFEIRISDGQPAADLYFLYVSDSDDGLLFYVRVRTDGRLRVEPTGGTANYINDTDGSLVYLPDGDTGVFYLKFRYKKGSGSDGEVEAWYSTDGAWGNSGYSVSDLTTTTQFANIMLYDAYADTITVYFDEVKVNDSNISDY